MIGPPSEWRSAVLGDNRFVAAVRATFRDMWFRSLIGPAQTRNAVHGADRYAREAWKRDLEARKQYSRDQRARRRSSV
jgi:hypothetical protein